MSVYVAGKFEETPLVRSVQDAILEAGFSISHDWTPLDAWAEGSNVPTDVQHGIRCAAADLRGVRAAKIVVVIPHPHMKGGYVEVGGGLILDKPVVAYFPDDAQREARMEAWNKQIFSVLCEPLFDLKDVLNAVYYAHELPAAPLSFAVCNERITTVRP